MVCILTDLIADRKHNGMYFIFVNYIVNYDGMYPNQINFLEQTWWYVFWLTQFQTNTLMTFIQTESITYNKIHGMYSYELNCRNCLLSHAHE